MSLRLQSLLKALESYTCMDVYYERRDESYMIVLHNPFHPQTRHNLADWNVQVHSKVGFRCASFTWIANRIVLYLA